jgi:hypothetical protein
MSLMEVHFTIKMTSRSLSTDVFAKEFTPFNWGVSLCAQPLSSA